mgnify:CR=1 FL=1
MSKFSHKFFAGVCMGIAEITPGISGATIAGLFNVYKDFVTFLNVFNPFKTVSYTHLRAHETN